MNRGNDCKIRLLKGAEVSIIDHNGRVTVANDILEKLDLVIASNHIPEGKLSKADIKSRFMNVIRNKHIHIVGHLTRYIKKLDKNDWQEIILEAEKQKKVLEYNLRAPLQDKLINFINKRKIYLSIGSDVHPEVIKESAFSLDDYLRLYTKKANGNTAERVSTR